jgi:hypothetical protein
MVFKRNHRKHQKKEIDKALKIKEEYENNKK